MYVYPFIRREVKHMKTFRELTPFFDSINVPLFHLPLFCYFNWFYVKELSLGGSKDSREDVSELRAERDQVYQQYF